MELLIGITAVITVLVSFAIYSLVMDYRERKRRKPQCILYLLKVDDAGNIEIKKSPKNEIWNWRF